MLMKPLVDTATALGARSLYDVRVQSPDRRGRWPGGRESVARQYGNESPSGPDAASSLRPAASPTTTRWSRSTRRGSPAGRPRRSSSTTARRSGWHRRSAPTSRTWTPPRSRSSSTPSRLVRGILVNGRGQRYVPEDTYPGRIGQLTLYHQDNTAYLIIDGDAQDEAMAATSATPFLKRPATWVCDTVADLEARDRACRRLAAGHRRRLQRRRRARRGSAAAQEAGVARAHRLSGRRHRPARELPAASPSAACRPPSTARCCTSAASRSPDSTPRAAPPPASPHGVTPAASRSATAASTAAARAAPPPRADALLPRRHGHACPGQLCIARHFRRFV